MTIVEEQLARYTTALERWASERDSDVRAANRQIDKACELYAALRVTAEGRTGIAKLMHHPLPSVRLWAASHSLPWATEDAVRLLEDFAQAKGLDATTARYTLLEYRSGRLAPCGLAPLKRET